MARVMCEDDWKQEPYEERTRKCMDWRNSFEENQYENMDMEHLGFPRLLCGVCEWMHYSPECCAAVLYDCDQPNPIKPTKMSCAICKMARVMCEDDWNEEPCSERMRKCMDWIDSFEVNQYENMDMEHLRNRVCDVCEPARHREWLSDI
tara:strand:+ start:363 stop:809 length:447 start_codon:yes stop_codon:yes gene_type:complete